MGTYYIERRLDIGLFSISRDSWHFGLAPELGASLPIGRKTHAFFSTAWNFAFESGSISTQSYVNFNVGFLFL